MLSLKSSEIEKKGAVIMSCSRTPFENKMPHLKGFIQIKKCVTQLFYQRAFRVFFHRKISVCLTCLHHCLHVAVAADVPYRKHYRKYNDFITSKQICQLRNFNQLTNPLTQGQGCFQLSASMNETFPWSTPMLSRYFYFLFFYFSLLSSQANSAQISLNSLNK